MTDDMKQSFNQNPQQRRKGIGEIENGKEANSNAQVFASALRERL